MIKTKNCDKGIPCGHSCIEKKDDCLHDVGLNSKSFLNKIAQLAEKYALLSGNFKALDKIADNLAEPELESIATFYQSLINKPKAERTGSKMVSLEDIEYFAANQLNKYEQAFDKSFDEKGKLTLEGTKKYIDSNVKRVKISDELTLAVWESLPTNLKNKLKGAGDPRLQAWQNKSIVRGQQLLKRYLEQGGIDPYTGRFVDLNDAELEHIIPETVGGLGSDHPNNWAWIRADINKWHSNKTAQEWRASTEKILKDKEVYAAKVANNKAAADTQKRNLSNNNKAIEEAYSVGKTPEERQIFARKVAEALKTKSKKLISASGLPESFQELRVTLLPAIKNRTQSIDSGASKMVDILQSKQKPSSLMFQALAFTADNKEVNGKLRAEYAKAMEKRKLNFEEAADIYNNQGKEVHQKALLAKNLEFAMALKAQFDSIPGFSYD